MTETTVTQSVAIEQEMLASFSIVQGDTALVVANLGRVDFELNVPSSCPAAQLVLPSF